MEAINEGLDRGAGVWLSQARVRTQQINLFCIDFLLSATPASAAPLDLSVCDRHRPPSTQRHDF